MSSRFMQPSNDNLPPTQPSNRLSFTLAVVVPLSQPGEPATPEELNNLLGLLRLWQTRSHHQQLLIECGHSPKNGMYFRHFEFSFTHTEISRDQMLDTAILWPPHFARLCRATFPLAHWGYSRLPVGWRCIDADGMHSRLNTFLTPDSFLQAVAPVVQHSG